jgi:peptidoglycan/xylan/chitin deacetylase (PgdA/CDA1 family)
MSPIGLAKTNLASLSARMLKVRPARLAGLKPVASLTFDDFPRSAWTEGGPVLARHGARGTYYTAGGLRGRTENGTVFYDEGDLRALAAAGHEIGSQGFSHEPTPMLTPDELTADADRNREFLKPFLNGKAPLSYAYPFGQVSPRTKRHHAPRYASLRGVHSGINAGRVDLAQLNAISLERRCWDEGKIRTAIQLAQHEPGWLIFYTHDVSGAPSEYGSTPEMLDRTLSWLAEARIPVLPVREALRVALGASSFRPDSRQGGGGRDPFGVEPHMDDGRQA